MTTRGRPVTSLRCPTGSGLLLPPEALVLQGLGAPRSGDALLPGLPPHLGMTGGGMGYLADTCSLAWASQSQSQITRRERAKSRGMPLPHLPPPARSTGCLSRSRVAVPPHLCAQEEPQQHLRWQGICKSHLKICVVAHAVISALGRLRQEDFLVNKTSLSYIVTLRDALSKA